MIHLNFIQKHNIKKYLKKIKIISLTSGLILIIDQICKFIVLIKIPIFNKINIISNIINITHIQNRGIAFGLMSNNNHQFSNLIFILISYMSICYIILYYKKFYIFNKISNLSLSLIIGGTISNTVDRIRFGKVIDFIDLSIWKYHWPVFNVADSSIIIGTIIFMFLYISSNHS